MTNSFANAAGLMTVVESQPALLMAQADKAFLYIKITLECPGGGSNCLLGLCHALFDCMSKRVEPSLNGLFCMFLHVFLNCAVQSLLDVFEVSIPFIQDT